MVNNPHLTKRLTIILAIATGLSVANIYYNQPLLKLMAAGFRSHAQLIYASPSATQMGYAAGLFFLVPLGDLLNRRTLILWQTAALAVSLAIFSTASSAAIVIAGSILVGITSTVAQQIIPLAAELSRPEQRGQVIGTVMSGLLAGILLARTLSGFIGQYFGWRAVYTTGVVIAIALGLMLFRSLPNQPQTPTSSYRDLLLSMGRLAKAYPALRWSVMRQGALFAAFSAFWTTLALFLAGPPYHWSSDAAGLYGILGLSGVLVAPQAGRLADKRGPSALIFAGGLIVLVGFGVFMAFSTSAVGIGIGVVVMDAGVQMAMIANQSVIFALEPHSRNRINTIYMSGMFLWGAVGSAIASIIWRQSGWTGVTLLGVILALLSLGSHLASRRHQGEPPTRRPA